MTPKEKALELVSKFKLYLGTDAVGEEYFTSDLDSKRCAYIAVDEILNNDGFTQFDIHLTEFWKQVKEEIEKL